MPLDAPSAAEYKAFADRGLVIPGQVIAPVRNGMHRRTGKLLTGWPHVVQSFDMMLQTRFHERILREYVGTFVPHLLGKNIVETTLGRFFWAIATGAALWEPCYKIERILIDTIPDNPLQVAVPTTVDSIRQGQISMATQGVYMPRGHLGDFTPDSQRGIRLVGRGGGRWDVSS